MNLFTRLTLAKEKVKVKEIPKKLLECKSQNRELEKKIKDVSFYYLQNGTKILSVLNNDNNQAMEVLDVLKSLDSIFHIKYNNLFVRKGDKKLLGYSYPLTVSKQAPKVNMTKLAGIICDANDQSGLADAISKKDTYAKNEARSILINTIFWYKILKYFNLQKISVKNLAITDIIGYNEEYSEKYIDIVNVISKLRILETPDVQEEIQVVNLCLQYFLNANPREVLAGEFYQFVEDFKANFEAYRNNTLTDLTFFENMNFLDVFYSQFERLETYECSHEFDNSYLRCPICNSSDKFITRDEYNEIFSGKNRISVEDDLTMHYISQAPFSDNGNTLYFSLGLDEDKFKCVKRYYNKEKYSRYKELKSSFIYDENSKLVSVALSVPYSATFRGSQINNVKTYIKDILESLVKEDNYENFRLVENFFHTLFVSLHDLEKRNLTLNFEDLLNADKVLNSFILLTINKAEWLEVKPSKLALLENKNLSDSTEKIIANIFFSLVKEICSSELVDGNIVSKTEFDIIKLFNLNVIKEYEKYLAGQKYNAGIVVESIIATYGDGKSYDNSYVVNPRIYKSILSNKEQEALLLKDYEFVSQKIVDSNVFNKLHSKKELIIPEYIVYTKRQSGGIDYKGYYIKKLTGKYVMDAFDNMFLSKQDNKKIMEMLLTFYKFAKTIGAYAIPWEYLCFDSSYSTIFARYQNVQLEGTKPKERFKEVVERLKNSEFYFSDFLFIIEDSIERGYDCEKSITKIYDSFTNYCKAHNSYYEKSLAKCPICSKYYEFIDMTQIDTSSCEYENENYKMIKYKTRTLLKLYKTSDEETLICGKKMKALESDLLSILKNNTQQVNMQRILKIVKDSNTEKTIGILISKKGTNEVAAYDVLSSSSSTNITYIQLLMALINNFENIAFVFTRLNLTSSNEMQQFLKYHLLYNQAKSTVYIADYELFGMHEIRDSDINLSALKNLDKLSKFIIYNSEKCYDLRGFDFPKVDLEYLKNLYGKLEDMEIYYTESTARFCPKHSVYYNSKDGMCPLCVKEMDEFWIESPDQKGREVNFGGEAFIYSLGLSSLIKGYKRNKISTDDEEVTAEVQKLLDEDEKRKSHKRENVLKILRPLYDTTKKELENKNFLIPFPSKLAYAGKNKKFIGFVQDKIPNVVSFFLFTNTKECEKYGFKTPLSLLEVLISYGEGVEYLHNSETIRKVTPDGIVVGDVSGKNAVYSTYLRKVGILDMDSVGIKGYPAFTLTDDYSDPLCVKGDVLIKEFSFDSDWYSYAIICFYVLTKVHPFDGVYDNNYQMTINERKEKKISVIGKHKSKITLPSVVVPWDWMPKYLLNAFIDIFEKDKRYSILNVLKKAYNELNGVEKYVYDSTSEVELDEQIFEEEDVFKEKEQSQKRGAITVELLANKLPNNSLDKKSTELLLSGDLIYYREKTDKNFLCDTSLDYEGYLTDSEDELVNYGDYDFEEIFVRDGKGVATIIDENGVKFIGIVKDDTFTKMYQISDSNRVFDILYDTFNNRYLFISDSKSYVILNDKKIVNYTDVYNVDIKTLNVSNDGDFESKVTYVGNSLYYAEEGCVCRFNLNTGECIRINCPLATRESAVKVFADAIIVVTEKEILKLITKK